jgi:hypothetical protein
MEDRMAEMQKFTTYLLVGWTASEVKATNEVLLELRYYVGLEAPKTEEEMQTNSRSLHVRMSAVRADELGQILRTTAATILHPPGTWQ